jgi:hypothetical protein
MKQISATQYARALNPADAAGYPASFTGSPVYTKQ